MTNNHHSKLQETIMPDHDVTTTTASGASTQPGFVRKYLVSQLHLIVMVALGMVGAVYTDLNTAASLSYWRLLAPVFGLICIISQWSRLPRLELIRSQVLHWAVFLGVMQLLFLPVMQQNLNSDITGIFLLVLLAMSTFLAGVYLDWRLGVAGVFLGVCALMIAYLDKAAGLIVVAAIVIVALAVLWQRVADRWRQPSD